MSATLVPAHQLAAARDFTELHGITGAASNAKWAALAAKLAALGADVYAEAQALLEAGKGVDRHLWITQQEAATTAGTMLLCLHHEAADVLAGRAQGVPESKLALLYPLPVEQQLRNYVDWLHRLTEAELHDLRKRLKALGLSGDQGALAMAFDIAKLVRSGGRLRPQNGSALEVRIGALSSSSLLFAPSPKARATLQRLVFLGSEVVFWLAEREALPLGAQVNHVHLARALAALMQEFGVVQTHADLLREFHVAR